MQQVTFCAIIMCVLGRRRRRRKKKTKKKKRWEEAAMMEPAASIVHDLPISWFTVTDASRAPNNSNSMDKGTCCYCSYLSACCSITPALHCMIVAIRLLHTIVHHACIASVSVSRLFAQCLDHGRGVRPTTCMARMQVPCFPLPCHAMTPMSMLPWF
jgi:hypothetical protein